MSPTQDDGFTRGPPGLETGPRLGFIRRLKVR